MRIHPEAPFSRSSTGRAPPLKWKKRVRALPREPMKWPSIKNENPLTWKCKLFGCQDEDVPHMRKNTLEKVYLALRDLEPQINMSEDLMNRARVSINRMMELS